MSRIRSTGARRRSCSLPSAMRSRQETWCVVTEIEIQKVLKLSKGHARQGGGTPAKEHLSSPHVKPPP